MAFLISIGGFGLAHAEQHILSAEQWARPRSGLDLVTLQPLATAVRMLDRDSQLGLTIGYPGGEEGSLWAHELRSWLVALGLPSRRIQLVSGSRHADALELRVEPQGARR